MLDETTLQLLTSLGPTGIMAVAVLMFVRMAKSVMPSEHVQSQMFGFMERQLELVGDLKSAIERGDERNASALDKFTAFMETFTARVGAEHQQAIAKTQENKAAIDAVQQSIQHQNTQLLTITGAVETMAKNPETTGLHEKLDRIINELAAIRADNLTHFTRTEQRLDAVEAALPPLMQELPVDDQSQATDNHEEQPKDAAPAKAPPPAAFSKSQAKQNHVTPVVKSDESTKDENDNELGDPVPIGG